MEKKWYVIQLEELGACKEAINWAATQPDAQTAWNNCARSDWMHWLIKTVLWKKYTAIAKYAANTDAAYAAYADAKYATYAYVDADAAYAADADAAYATAYADAVRKKQTSVLRVEYPLCPLFWKWSNPTTQ